MAAELGPHLWEVRAGRELIQLALLLAGLAGVVVLRNALAPVIVALVFGYMLEPVVSWAQKRLHWRRGLTATLLLLVLAGAVVVAAVMLLPLTVRELLVFRDDLTAFWQATREGSPDLLRQALDKLVDYLKGRVLDTVRGLPSLGDILRQTVVTLIFFWYFATNLPLLRRRFAARRDPDGQARRERLLADFDASFEGFLWDRLLSMILMGVLLAVGWRLAGVHYWLVLGALGGLLNAIPFLSSLAWMLALVLGFVNAVAEGQGLPVMTVFVWPTVVYLVVQIGEELLLEPLIESRKGELSPVAALLALIVGGATGGYVGLLVAIPVTVFLKKLLGRLGPAT